MGFTELAIIVVLALIVFFGGKKIAELSKSAGRATAEFKKGKMEAEKELNEMIKESSSDEKKE
ncbi:MAG: twin-arginine translocase TatA/TatE family subunit [Candidatus Colwellbacteria bacterium]|jgi:sec-independent protein translocase protein TatA|nr:twin-arginine translocase TatA/TatE family subunit [Candidatus Colwellbacteria bacterium]MCK9497378.1 twin-arginine translocase TatA/TatE family subunit [Candidatus Colwellbacteria bacterium]MDD3752878.1 twin-arginine translocase TatA/TatE family subunit [Candidatus Colwellbacteria bacterium]